MNRLPPDFDPTIFRDAAIQLIAVAVNQVYFHFSNGVLISTDAEIISMRAGESVVADGALSMAFFALLEEPIMTAVVEEERRVLALTFPGERTLMFTDLDFYEAFSIQMDDKTIYV